MNIDAELHDWVFVGTVAFGRIFNDRKLRFSDGTVVRTSAGVIEDDILVTKNSTYKLIGEGKIQ